MRCCTQVSVDGGRFDEGGGESITLVNAFAFANNLQVFSGQLDAPQAPSHLHHPSLLPLTTTRPCRWMATSRSMRLPARRVSWDTSYSGASTRPAQARRRRHPRHRRRHEHRHRCCRWLRRLHRHSPPWKCRSVYLPPPRTHATKPPFHAGCTQRLRPRRRTRRHRRRAGGSIVTACQGGGRCRRYPQLSTTIIPQPPL